MLSIHAHNPHRVQFPAAGQKIQNSDSLVLSVCVSLVGWAGGQRQQRQCGAARVKPTRLWCTGVETEREREGGVGIGPFLISSSFGV